jgi:alkylhydroperoxidase/carboxymuconolactone decarboxylase family protein YurZ
MASNKWTKEKEGFEVIDVRTLRGNFLPMIKQKAAALEEGQGICIIQSFEPIPLYTVLGEMGFEHETIKISAEEYRAYFYRARKLQDPSSSELLQPLGILKFKQVDTVIADHMVRIWGRIYRRESASIEHKNLYLIAFGVGVGAGRMRQAARELIKAYAAGASAKELDEVFALLIWLEGAATFVSEISTSTVFAIYEMIKRMEGQNKSRDEILAALTDKFGEGHPEVGIFGKPL